MEWTQPGPLHIKLHPRAPADGDMRKGTGAVISSRVKALADSLEVLFTCLLSYSPLDHERGIWLIWLVNSF